MKQHIILAAFGTTTLARNTYNHLDSIIKPRFPQSTLHWHFTSPAVHKKISPLEDLLATIAEDKEYQIIVQSVYVSPGQEFHRLVRAVLSSSVPAAIGMPLLTTPEDHKRVAELLLPIIKCHRNKGILILGHGTYHPSWTVLPAFEKTVRETAGNHVFVTALEKYPSSRQVIEKIAAKGFSEVLVIPLLITAGMHFQRDIIGESPESWKNRLEKKGITLSLHEEGLGLLDGVAELISDHIIQATR